MFAICIEASHSKGMGHLFRMLNFVNYLNKQDEQYIFFINNDEKTKQILEEKNIKYEIIDLFDISLGWENQLIEKYKIKYWLNDRLDTDEQHAQRVKNQAVTLITFDDLGSGSIYSDINICGLFFGRDDIKGKKILKGAKFLILNGDIDLYKRERTHIENVLVTLGGSDTYGVTVKVLRLLKKYNIKATLHVGPSFMHKEELEAELTANYKLVSFIPSLVEEFSKCDLAITGGGITPFEANASGLPCLIIANELFEIQNGQYLDSVGSSKFIGHHKNIDESIFNNLSDIQLDKMSTLGMKKLDTNAMSRIYKEIKNYE